MKDKIIPIASVLVGILAFFLTNQYLTGERNKLAAERAKLYEGAQKIYVTAAARDIPAGVTIEQKDLGKKAVYKSSVSDRVIMPAEAPLIIGKKTMFPISAKSALTWSDIEGGIQGKEGLSSIIQHNLRAISISVGGANSVSSMVRPNDRIDVLGTFSFPSKDNPQEMETTTLTLLQDVTVLATGQEMAKQRSDSKRRSSNYSTVTVEVTPREAELLVFAQNTRGSLTLSLRSSSDVSYESELPNVNFEEIKSRLKQINEYRQKNIRFKR